MLNAKNIRLRLATGEMDCIRFGSGGKTLVMIPGVGDGLKTVKGMAQPFALMYRKLAKDFTVYVFSRRVELPEHSSTREMAVDLKLALDALGIDRAAVVGVSQGGMIAQWLAIDWPEKVEKLVLTVTYARPNDTACEAIGRWIEMAQRGDYRAIMRDTAERCYSPKRRPAAVLSAKLMGNYGRPKSFDRFLTQAESCLTHDAENELGRISCPTLVIGGTDDRVVTGAASHEIASRISGSRMKLYKGLGHALYEEAPDFLELVRDFCV